MNARRAFVQGAGRGVGLAVAERLARAATALAVGTRDDRPDLVEHLRSLGAPEVLAIRVDVTEPAAVRAAFAELATRWESLDVLVNVVGPPVERRPWEETPDDAWTSAFELGVLSAVRTTRAALPLLRAAAPARVVNVSALSATVQAAGIAAYSAAKAALNSVTKTMSVELAPHVLVNAVSPGAILSRRLEESLAAAGRSPDDTTAAFELIRARHDLRGDLAKVATPDEVAAAICFLCSADNSHITGVNLHVDGGTASPL
ncbi:SDR family oxidoreductase [Amycolatopsis rhabdoformis]|uniref:SDR family oxidoreductase n=1 Tax=Amycolatopsis rhabdoformis TaxID=1448059 RepID=A0ABZ1IFS7_9PSEU|nr:SDR family oxidoreductase [Amycolatopsis rhabdoformis]WSE32558.1 SDR family oxidoreductase [Amycolatopsis rhabdoformis]